MKFGLRTGKAHPEAKIVGSKDHRNLRKCTLVFVIAWLVSPVVSSTSSFAVDSKGPNVLFIVADDLGTELGCYGNSMVRSPNIDRLSAHSVRFDQAYCQYPSCNPSRSSFLSGLRPDTTKIAINGSDARVRDNVPSVVTLPQLFKNKGYYTMRVGKIFHYDVPADIGTDGRDDAPSWNQVVNPRGKDRDQGKKGKDSSASDGGKGGGGKGGGGKSSLLLGWSEADGTDEEQTDGMVATEAIRLMEKNRDKPFFLAVGFFRPHTPYIAPKKYYDLYPLDKIQMAKGFPNDRNDIPPDALWINPPNFGLSELQCREAIRAYYACVSFMDAQVGRLLDALDRLKLTDNTIVVFLGDHGYALGEHGLWLKQSLFEEATRTPLIMAIPGNSHTGKSCARVVELLDLYPTLADVAHLVPPSNLQGRSLVPLLMDPGLAWQSAAYTQCQGGGRSVRTERWRYTEWSGGQNGKELYDHQSDPQEYTNLANDPKYSLAVKEMQQLLHRQ